MVAGGYLMTDFTVNPVNMGLDTPQPSHAANALEMYRTGMDDRALQDKGFLRQQVGSQLAAGASPLEAAQMAFAGGDIKTGAELQNLSREQLVGITEWMGKFADAADTPEKWAQGVSAMERVFGPEEVAPYRDFSTRSMFVDEQKKLLEQLDIEAKRTGIEKAQAETAKLRGEADPSLSGFKDKKQKVDVEAGMRKEFSTLSKDFRDVRDAYRRVTASAADPSAAGDLALIFNYMKILDPGSTVREGEFANAQNSGGVPEQVAGLYNSVLNGKRLSANIRTDFVDRAERLYGAQKEQHEKLVGDFKSRTERLGLSVENVLPDFGSAKRPIDAEGQTSDGRKWTGTR